MILSGRLTDWSVGELLQILHVTAKTASLEVQGADRGESLYFRDGRIVDAELAGTGRAESARDRIVETVYVLQLLPDGSFTVGNREPEDTGVMLDVSEAVELADRHLATEVELRESGLLEAGVLELTPEVDQPVTIEPSQWSVVTRVAGAFTLEMLEERVGRARAVETVMGLWKLGLVQPSSAGVSSLPDDPTTWWLDPETAGAGKVIELEEVPVGADAPTEVDDEARMLAEAASSADAAWDAVEAQAPAQEANERRKEMKAVISPADTMLVPGVLDDIRQRFRPVEQQ